MKPFFCIRCVRWYGECSRSEHSGLCYHCWRYVCEYGLSAAFTRGESLPVGFSWRGALVRIA
jgi:hypothetical protein